MKLILKAAFICLILNLTACRKQDTTATAEQTTISKNEKLVITNYLNSRKTRTDELGIRAIDTVLQQVNWDRYFTAKDKAGNKLTVFELNTVSLNKVFLLLYKGENSDAYSDAQLAVVKDNNSPGLNKAELIANVYSDRKFDFTGSIEYYQITKEFVFTRGYKNGQSEYTKVHDMKKGKPGGNAVEETCYNVYLVTYWNDGSTTYDFLYSYCVSDCPDMRAGGSINISTGNIENTARCGASSGGGSGTGSTNNNSECVNLPTAIEILNSSYAVSETNSTIVGPPIFRPNIGVEEVTITKNWTFYKGNTLFGTFYLTSSDKAVKRKLNNGNWYFVSASHINHGVASAIPFTSVSITSLVATGIVHTYTRAEVRLNYGVKIHISCYGTPIGGDAEVSNRESNVFFN
jgi:hypothetical protein